MAISDKHPIAGTVSSANQSESISPQDITANSQGFTLLELLVVTSIIGILATLSLSAFTIFKENARRARCMGEIRGIEKDIDAFAIQNIRFPDNLGEIGRAGMLDPWGRPYNYKIYVAGAVRDLAGVELNTDYDLYSNGVDGFSVQSLADSQSEDDIVRANSGGFVGTGLDFGTP